MVSVSLQSLPLWERLKIFLNTFGRFLFRISENPLLSPESRCFCSKMHKHLVVFWALKSGEKRENKETVYWGFQNFFMWKKISRSFQHTEKTIYRQAKKKREIVPGISINYL